MLVSVMGRVGHKLYCSSENLSHASYHMTNRQAMKGILRSGPTVRVNFSHGFP